MFLQKELPLFGHENFNIIIML